MNTTAAAVTVTHDFPKISHTFIPFLWVFSSSFRCFNVLVSSSFRSTMVGVHVSYDSRVFLFYFCAIFRLILIHSLTHTHTTLPFHFVCVCDCFCFSRSFNLLNEKVKEFHSDAPLHKSFRAKVNFLTLSLSRLLSTLNCGVGVVVANSQEHHLLFF